MQAQSKATLFGLGAVLCWSTVATAFKLSLGYLSPAQLMLVASITACLFYGGVLLLQGRIGELFRQSITGYRKSIGFGLLNPALYYLLLFFAYDLLPAQEAQAINYSWAIVMTLLAVPLLKQSMRRDDIIAAVICYLGVLVIATRGNLLAFEFDSLPGVALALASTVVWSLYWIFNRRDAREPVLGLCLNFAFAIPFILLYCALTGQLQTFPWPGVMGGIYVGLVEMGLAFLLWLHAMKLTESTAKIANLIFISPFLSLVFIATILGEPILWSTMLALVLIVTGLLVQGRKPSTPRV